MMCLGLNSYRSGCCARNTNLRLFKYRRKQKSVRFMDWFHKIYAVERNFSKRIHVSGSRLKKNQTTSRPDHIWLDAWTRIGKDAQRREKRGWAIEKPKLECARHLRRSYSIDPSDEDDKNIIKTSRCKLETPMEAAIPCKRDFSKASIRETVVPKTEQATASDAKTRFSCIAEAHESTRQRIE